MLVASKVFAPREKENTKYSTEIYVKLYSVQLRGSRLSHPLLLIPCSSSLAVPLYKGTVHLHYVLRTPEEQQKGTGTLRNKLVRDVPCELILLICLNLHL